MVYLYLMAMIGLILLTIGSVRFVDLGLKAYVFTRAEEEERMHWRDQPPVPVHIERVRRLGSADDAALTPEERAALRDWARQYESWKERMERVDPIASRRQRAASSSLAMILIGLPLYLFHWSLIRRESRG